MYCLSTGDNVDLLSTGKYTGSGSCYLMLLLTQQVIQAIDTIQRQPKQTVADLDSPECISTLHTLYSMTLTAVGRSIRLAIILSVLLIQYQ